MKIICTTSNRYQHILPIFCYLFNKYWPGARCELVGYDPPTTPLPNNIVFHSLGKQGDVSEWSTDLRKYFEQQPDIFIWIMEDTFFKAPVKVNRIYEIPPDMLSACGRINLTDDVSKRGHTDFGSLIVANQDSLYRLSTQPSIWNKHYLLQYLKDGLTPWQFEKQNPMNDGWLIVGMRDYPVIHNEGVRKHDIFDYDLSGMDPEDINYIKSLSI